MLRRASDIARDARLYNDEDTPFFLQRPSDFATLMLEGAEILSEVHERDGSIHYLITYDDLRFGHIARSS